MPGGGPWTQSRAFTCPGELGWWLWQSKLLGLTCYCGGKHRGHGMPCDHCPVNRACRHMNFTFPTLPYRHVKLHAKSIISCPWQ